MPLVRKEIQTMRRVETQLAVGPELSSTMHLTTGVAPNPLKTCLGVLNQGKADL